MADRPGILYLRTRRSGAPTLYDPGETFAIGGSVAVRSGDEDAITLAGCGVTVHEALEAAEALERDGLRARVLDLYSVKPIDTQALLAAAEETGGIVVAEDHWPEGGLGEAVLAALAAAGTTCPVRLLGVSDMPVSGKPEELLAAAGIDSEAIAGAARELLDGARSGRFRRSGAPAASG